MDVDIEGVKNKKLSTWIVLMALLSAQVSDAAVPTVLRGIAAAAPAARSVRPILRSAGGSFRAAFHTRPHERSRNLNRFLLLSGAGLGAAGLSAVQWRRNHPEDQSPRFPEIPTISRDPGVCRTPENYSFTDLKKRINESELFSVLRRALFGPYEHEEFNREVPQFFKQKELNDLKYEDLRVFFNEGEEEDEEGSSSPAPRSRGPFKTRLEKTIESTGLTEQEVLSIYMYSLSSDGVNASLRQEGDRSAPLINGSIQSGLKKLAEGQSLPSEVPLYRGTTLPALVFNQMKEKGTFTDPGYLSTSFDVHVSTGFIKEGIPETENVLFVIEGAKSGANIHAISSYGDQGEVLFPARTEFQIKSMIKDEAHGRWEVRLQEKE